MEVSKAVHRGLRQAFARPAQSRQLSSVTTPSTRTTRQQITRTAIRPFSSTAHNQQDSPSQTRPNSQQNGLRESPATSLRNPAMQRGPTPDPNKRVDLSSLPGIPSSYVPPSAGKQPQAASASSKLDALFNRPRRASENPYQNAIRQTDAMNKTGNVDMLELFRDITLSRNEPINEPTKINLRLKPTLGRTQKVDNGYGMDLNRAFRVLDTKCNVNGVRRDMMKQRFHVRRGQRRKLERSLRWRTAFKAGFLEECARVRRMKNQGW